ncbi:MAG: hypothetical protein SCALA701_19220 [Candidatus Scalindua sp.]|nr:MAG: hypothetical protein SCALA701_19220 [Candidatus Scalindua sp.]
MAIDVVGDITEEERTSIEFKKLSLAEALEKLSTNYGYLTDAEKGEKGDYGDKSEIMKISILPKGKEMASIRIATKESKHPEPFKFEFDPAEDMGGGVKPININLLIQ